MPADYAKRLHEARNFSHNAERYAYLGQTNQRDGTAQNPSVGHPEKHLVVAISCPNTTAQRLTYGLVSYAALTVVDDGTRAQKWSMQAIACLMNADLGVLSSNGREDGGIMLVTATLRYDANLLLQALAVQEKYNNLDAQVQADLTEEEWAAALEMAPLILAAGGAEADSVIYVLGYMLLKNVGGNERYMSEGFNSLRTALVRQNPALLSGLGRETAEESFLLPTRETCISGIPFQADFCGGTENPTTVTCNQAPGSRLC